MSLFIDKKFINIVSPQLDKFVWKKDNLANCRCPICGDSTTNKNKARGYFFANKLHQLLQRNTLSKPFQVEMKRKKMM
jgi:hypothetical protein